MSHGIVNQIQTEKTSFMDLVDDNLIEIMKYLDPISRRNTRISKRLDEAYLCVKNNMERIEIAISRQRYVLTMVPSNRRSPFTSDTVDGLIQGLDRLALNTQFQILSVTISSYIERCDIVFAALSKFKTDKLNISSDAPTEVKLSTLLSFAKNSREVKIDANRCTVITKDLCSLRKTMLDGNCKLESFKIRLKRGDNHALLKECFGVIEDSIIRTRKVYYATDESIQLYSDNFGLDLFHYERDLETEISFIELSLKKCKGGAKPDSKYEKIQMNRLYPR